MQLASASTTVKIHDFPSGTVIHNYQPGIIGDHSIRCISWSKNGNWLALTPYSGHIEIVSVKDKLQLLKKVQNIEEPSCCTFENMSKRRIGIGTKNGLILLYDVKSKNILKRFSRCPSEIYQIEFMAKDDHVIASCLNGEILLNSNITDNLSATFKIPQSESVTSIKSNPLKRNYFTAGSKEGYVAVWDINNNKQKFLVESHKAPVTAVAFSTVNPDLILSTGLDRQFCIYDINANKRIARIPVVNSITSVDFSPNGIYIIMGSQNGTISVYDARSIKEPIQSINAHNFTIKHLAFKKNDDIESSQTSFVGDDIEIQQNIEISPAIQKNKNESFDVSLLPDFTTPNDKTDGTNETSYSLLNALGINNTTWENVIEGDEQEIPITINNNTTPITNTQNLNNILPNVKVPTTTVKTGQLSSTPKYLSTAQSTPNFSPIVSTNKIINNNKNNNDKIHDNNNLEMKHLFNEIKLMIEDFRNEMRTNSNNEVKKMIEDFRQTLYTNLSKDFYNIRKLIYNFQMFMTKQSLKNDENFDILKNELLNIPDLQDNVFDENIMLKERLAIVEEELNNLKSALVNNTSNNNNNN